MRKIHYIHFSTNIILNTKKVYKTTTEFFQQRYNKNNKIKIIYTVHPLNNMHISEKQVTALAVSQPYEPALHIFLIKSLKVVAEVNIFNCISCCVLVMRKP